MELKSLQSLEFNIAERAGLNLQQHTIEYKEYYRINTATGELLSKASGTLKAIKLNTSTDGRVYATLRTIENKSKRFYLCDLFAEANTKPAI